MLELWPVVGLVIGVLAVTGLAHPLRVPPPILLLAVGFGASFIPGVPPYSVSPGLVLTVLIPPLLYAAAVESGVVAIRRLIRPILQLAVGMVLVTAFAVALVLHAIFPDVPFGAALALGAIVAPPDAVAAVAVGRRVGLPRTVMTVLEGESLFNDATSLVTLKVALAAVGASSVSWGAAVAQFAWESVGGVIAGLAVGLLLSFARRRIARPLTVTALSLVTPYLAYLVGEEIRASGVLAVVIAGLLLGYRSPSELPARVRLTELATWSTLRFVLEGAVFALIGLQLWAVIAELEGGVPHILVAIVAVLVTVLLVRPMWIFGVALVLRALRRRPMGRGKDHAAASWAGMRGVVSLAAAQTLPLDIPHRSVLLLATVAVIIGTLVLQGLSLPWVIRTLNFPGDPAAEDHAEHTAARAAASAEIARRIDEVGLETGSPPEKVQMMHRWAKLRDWRTWTDGDGDGVVPPVAALQRWQREIVRIEREVFLGMRNGGALSEDVLRELQNDLDLEEALLESRTPDDAGAADGHLPEIPDPTPPEVTDRNPG